MHNENAFSDFLYYLLKEILNAVITNQVYYSTT